MTSELFQLKIIDRDGIELDTDDCQFTYEELDRFLSDCNAELLRINRADAYEVDMADGSRGFVRVVGVDFDAWLAATEAAMVTETRGFHTNF